MVDDLTIKVPIKIFITKNIYKSNIKLLIQNKITINSNQVWRITASTNVNI